MTELERSAASTLTALYAAAAGLVVSWPSFTSGLGCGLLLGIGLSLLMARRTGKGRGMDRIGHGLLALAPAVVACLLWGLWLGIVAAKSLAR